MYFSLIILLLISYARTQQDTCSCFCCVGQFCNPIYTGIVSIQFCTSETCRTYCRNLYQQCQRDPPNGQNLPQCSSMTSTISPLYNCQCDCCNTGSTSCIPSFVGYSTAYSCLAGSCSISCATKYPYQCVSNQNGQTLGTCTGLITTTTTTTTTTTSTTVSTTSGSSLGNTCSCMCCQSGPNCSPDIEVGKITVPQCSSSSCTTTCQNQYPSACPSLAYLGRTNGVCTNQNNVNTRCQCQCCGTNGCSSYDVYANTGCTSCYTLCRQRCDNTNTVTFNCVSDISNKSIQISVPFIIFITIFIVPLYSIF